VKDHTGAPVAGAEFAVVVVDEAVLALSDYQLHDPLDAFYSQIYPTLSTKYGRESIVLADPASVLTPQGGGATAETTAAAAPAPGTAASRAFGPTDAKTSAAAADASGYAGAAAPNAPSIDVRTNFDALAVFQPSVTTADDGTATVDVTLPDNLTRYRVMVVAVDGAEQFGKAEANITARLPLMIRPSAPRFLNFGDAIELPVIAQNQSDQAMVVDIALQTANLNITGAAGVRVNVPANDRVEVRFPVTAAQAGTARFRVGAVSGDAADAATIELPVYTPATAEAFATYGVIDDGAAIQPVLAPTKVIPQFGSLDVTTSSTSLQALTDAVLYIADYRYESSDGLASQILAIAALRQVLDAFDAAGLPSPKELDAAVATYIDKLLALQNDDGGFSYWVRNIGLEPYNSIQATHALVVAKANGYTVPQVKLDAALFYIAEIEQHTPPEWGQAARDALSAYALYVRHLAGTGDSAKANDLYARSGATLQLDALAWLWPSIDDPTSHAAIGKVFQNRAVETAGAANFATTYGDAANLILQSDRRTDGVILEALISEQPDSDLIPKVVTGLLGNRVAGRWDNIQENSFILLALKKYFDTYEQQTPDFVARVWLGDRFAGDHTFAGRSTDRVRVAIPTADLIAAGNTDLTLSKEGVGRLYYRIGLRYAPESLRLDPLDRGFVVGRSYEGVDDAADVSRDPDGTWRIKAGAKVRVRLTMVADSQRSRVALIDPLPAGLEIVNPSLATTADLPVDTQPVDSTNYYYWYRTWFDHQNLRDDRAEAFSSLLPAGTYDYSYIARATTPGTFVTPPTRAEEIYAPETFGRGGTDSVVIG
jgi:alpha-2-macroglobulin